MIYLFIIFILFSLIGVNFKNVSGIDYDALTIDRTTMINGFFVGIVFFSHFNSYVTTNNSFDNIYYSFFKIGQLMVTTFLFYSGYGIYESIKSKEKYIDNFFKTRIFKLYVSVCAAIVLYIILNFIIGKSYDIKTIALSTIGFSSIGNSNWFIFAMFCMYFSILFSFKFFKHDNLSALSLCLIFSFCYIFLVMKYLKHSWWVNTILCFNIGMFFSYFKDRILTFLSNKYHYILTIIILLMVSFLAIINNFKYNYFVYEIFSLMFVFFVVLISLKVHIGNKMLLWLGKNTFNIYILQRLSFIFYDYIGIRNYNIYMYFIISALTTFVIVYFFDKVLKQIYNILIYSKSSKFKSKEGERIEL